MEFTEGAVTCRRVRSRNRQFCRPSRWINPTLDDRSINYLSNELILEQMSGQTTTCRALHHPGRIETLLFSQTTRPKARVWNEGLTRLGCHVLLGLRLRRPLRYLPGTSDVL